MGGNSLRNYKNIQQILYGQEQEEDTITSQVSNDAQDANTEGE